MTDTPSVEEERFCLQCGPLPDRLVQDVAAVDDVGRCVVCRYRGFTLSELSKILARVGHTVVPTVMGAPVAAIVAWYESTPENRDDAEEQLRKVARAAVTGGPRVMDEAAEVRAQLAAVQKDLEQVRTYGKQDIVALHLANCRGDQLRVQSRRLERAWAVRELDAVLATGKGLELWLDLPDAVRTLVEAGKGCPIGPCDHCRERAPLKDRPLKRTDEHGVRQVQTTSVCAWPSGCAEKPPTTWPKRILEALHEKCIHHRAAVEASALCGCFRCLRVYPPSEIKEWVRRDGDDTAVCPYCSVDSVLPNLDVELTAELLIAMRDRWFSRSKL